MLYGSHSGDLRPLEMGEDVCAPAVCGAGVWYAVGRYNIRESIIGNLFVIYLVF